MPSGNILHVRGRGSKFRFRLADVHGVAAAQNVFLKIKGSGGTANFGLLRDPSFVGPRMRTKCINAFLSVFFDFHQKDSKKPSYR